MRTLGLLTNWFNYQLMLEYGHKNVIFDDCIVDWLLLWISRMWFFMSQNLGIGLKTLISNSWTSPGFKPTGPRFGPLEWTGWAFGLNRFNHQKRWLISFQICLMQNDRRNMASKPATSSTLYQTRHTKHVSGVSHGERCCAKDFVLTNLPR